MKMGDIYDHLATLLKGYGVKKVLDLGAGDGTLGLYLREYGYDGLYKGVDKDRKACAKMELKGVNYELADLKWIDYRKNSWGAVVMQDVLEHLENISILANAISVANSYFILTTEAALIDSITPAPHPPMHFCIDDILNMALMNKFHLHDYHRLDNHSIMVFMKPRKGRKR